MDSYGPDESKLIGATMLASTLMLGTIFGYIVLSIKDMLSGRSPRDPKKVSVLMQAFVQGGGGGIYNSNSNNTVTVNISNNIIFNNNSNQKCGISIASYILQIPPCFY